MNHDDVGRSIRTLRQKKGWTLEELSTRCGLSVSFLSQVERGLSSLSISSLGTICDALGVPLTYFFSPPVNGPLVTKANQPRMRIKIEDSQATYDLLSGPIPNRELEVLISEYPPHYDPPLIRHTGEEFGYVLEGEVVLQVDDQVETLEQGDSFHILSTRPHTVRNPTDDYAKILWALTMKLMELGGHI